MCKSASLAKQRHEAKQRDKKRETCSICFARSVLHEEWTVTTDTSPSNLCYYTNREELTDKT